MQIGREAGGQEERSSESREEGSWQDRETQRDRDTEEQRDIDAETHSDRARGHRVIDASTDALTREVHRERSMQSDGGSRREADTPARLQVL